MMKKLLSTLCLFGLATTTYAEDLGPKRTNTGKIEVEKDYKLEADLGYLVNQSKSDGSSSTKENLAAHLLFQRQQGKWGQELAAEAVSTNDDSSSDNVERYLLSGKILHRSSGTIYQFAKLTGEKDLSSAFDYQLSATGGIGFDLIKDQKQSLSTEAGAGYRYSKERDEPKEDLNEFIGTVAAYYQYQVKPSVRFNQDLSYEFGAEARTLRSRSALSADLSKSFAAVASYNIKDVSADAGDSRDSLLSLGLRYKH